MIVLCWALLGVSLGWVANVVIRTGDGQGRILNIGLGVIGALCGGALIGAAGDAWAMSFDAFSVSAMLGASLGAAILLVLARLARVTG